MRIIVHSVPPRITMRIAADVQMGDLLLVSSSTPEEYYRVMQVDRDAASHRIRLWLHDINLPITLDPNDTVATCERWSFNEQRLHG